MRLGKLIKELEKHKPSNKIKFDFGQYPRSFDSYRGYYDQLAISKSDEPMLVGDLHRRALECVDQEFTGYKGGDYLMDETTPVWVSNYGHSDSIKIIRITDKGDNTTVIETYEDDY